MNDAARQELLDLAFLDDRWEFCGSSLRPVTLGTLNVCHRIGVPILGKDIAAKFAELDRTEQARRFLKFMWVHEESLDLRAMLSAVRSGSYAEQFADVEESPMLCPLFNAWLHRFNQMAEAASFSVVPRESALAHREDPPGTAIDPSWLVNFVDPIAARYGWSEAQLFWELPFVRALQYRHRALQASPVVWTVKDAPVGQEIKATMAAAVQSVAPDAAALDANEV